MKQEAVDKILKLLALSEDQAGMPEGQLAAKRAEELMLKYAISERDLAQTELIYRRIQTRYKRSPSWFAGLYHVISQFCGVFLVNVTGTSIFACVGKEEDIENLEYMGIVLTDRIDELAEQWAAISWLSTGKKPGPREKNSYRYGLMLGISGRMDKLTRKVLSHKGDQGNALTVTEANQRKRNLAKDYYHEKYGKTINNGGYDPDGKSAKAGMADAEGIALHAGVTGGTSRKAAGELTA